MVRIVAGLTLFSVWLLANIAPVSAQSPANVLTDGLLTASDLPGFRGVSPVEDQFPATEGLETLNVGFERDPGPVGVVSSIARASNARAAGDLFQLMLDGAVSSGIQSVSVPRLGDEAAGLTAPPSAGQPGVAHRYMFRKDGLIVMVTVLGPSGAVAMGDAVGLAITTSARVDAAIAAGAATSGGGATAGGPSSSNSSDPATEPGSLVAAPTAALTGASNPSTATALASRPAARQPSIEAEATFEAPKLNDDIEMGGFSGIAALDTSGTRFAILTDRGPNVFFRNRNQAVFAVPDYSPRILVVTVDGQTARLTESIPLRLPEGFVDPATGTREISGISTGDHDGPGYTMGRQRLPYDPNGVDSEGLARDPRDGSFWIADEYGPSIVHVAPDGTIKQRFVPTGLGLDAPGENVTEMLPSTLIKRKANRGFEGIAIAPDGSRVFAIMQSPLSNPGRKDGEESRIHRIVVLDTSKPDNVVFQGVYLYVAEEASRVRAPKQDDIKVGDMAAVSTTRLLVAERDSREGGPHRMVYTVDLSNATNVSSRDTVSGKTIEQLSEPDLKKANIEPVAKESLVDLAKLGFKLEKFEGLTIVDDTTLAITGDNDFGLAEADKDGEIELTSQPSRVMIVRLPTAIR